MAKVSLRIYNREIGTLVDQGQYNEAIGHCQHILKTFPKNLETYRVLGKAYLEAKVYNDAGDIFSRVLTSVPNDFVAHVGMSMIADEKSKGNEAIWHMQRAFEAQPSNAAVQSELQRLYSRRDGVEPAKIRMTSGALANIYVQGELYAQAIAEIMSVEAQDPGRMDMQVLLANAYFRSGQRVEASQTASDILAKSPYSLDANRILVEILPETSRAENAEVYRQRVNALDPYAAFVNDSVFNADDVPDAAISLERLNWNPENASQLSSRWGDSAGIELDEGKEPDWLKDDEGEIRDPELDSDMEISTEEEDIPDFMRAAGWGDSTGEAEPTSFFDSPAADPEAPATEDAVALDQAEMPDWMKTMAPSDAEESTAESDEEEIIGDDMASDEWINDLLDDKNNKEKSPQESPKSDTGIEDELIGNLGTSTDDQDAAMNWLESLAANQGAKAEELITDPNARTESAPEWVEQAKGASEEAPPAAKDEEDDALDWLNEAESKKEPLADASVDEMPDWMQDSSKEEKPLDEAADENMPEWMNDTSEEDIPITEILDNDMPDSMQDSSDDIEPAAEVSDSEMPDWMQEMKDESIMPEEESSAPVEMENASEAETLISDPAIGELGASEDEQDEAMNWLESL
ncbi:MAG: tetratricopeptide repeat protein, partial [Anaerolineae bacterium]|nr:tetratricopeptide repeat protein [Anaerolineae bacterium]